MRNKTNKFSVEKKTLLKLIIMKTKTLFIRVAFIAIFQLFFQMGISAQGWGCLSLPGGTSGVDCGLITTTTGKLTLETWVSGTGNLACNLDGPQNGFLIGYGGWSVITTAGGGNDYFQTSLTNQNDTWTIWEHIAVVFDGTSKTLYVNGVEFLSQPFPTPFVSSPATDLFFGHNTWDANSGSQMKFSDFRVWNTARTADEILANFQSHVPATSPGLLINYSFDEQQGNSTKNLVNPTLEANSGLLMSAESVQYEWGGIGVVPTNLVVTDKTATSFKLSWDGGFDNTWDVEIDDPDGGGLIDTPITKSDSVTDLTASSYTVKVRATYPIVSEWSVPMIIDMTTGIEKNQVYNSTITNQNGMITINNLEGANDIMIYNVSGTLVKQFKSTESNYKINATNLMQGLYLFKVKNDVKQKTFKVAI